MDHRVGHFDTRLSSKGCFSCIRMKVKVVFYPNFDCGQVLRLMRWKSSAIKQSRTAVDVSELVVNVLVTEHQLLCL
jgi:hypothetical protein